MIRKAVKELQKDELVVYPTETVYGLGANAFSEKAVEKVFEVKERPRSKPISVAVSSWDMLDEVAEINQIEKKVFRETLPGPVTYVVRRKETKSLELLASGKDKIGIRFPMNFVAINLISSFGKPITSTSANRDGEPAPRRFSEIRLDVSCRLFGGKPIYDSPSTVYDLVENKLIRRGPVPVSEIKKAHWR